MTLTSRYFSSLQAWLLLRRGLIDFTENKETMNTGYIVLESLRNGYDILVKHANRWVQCVLDYEDWDAPWASELWSMCLADARWVEPCVELGIRWDAVSKSLKVSAQVRNDLDAVDRVIDPRAHLRVSEV